MDVVVESDSGAMFRNWPSVVMAVVPWEQVVGVMHSPGVERSIDDAGCGHPPSYEYSHSFIARPEVWDGRPHTLSERSRLLRGTRSTEVRYPSQKALMWDADLGFLSNRPMFRDRDLAEVTPMLFADGHAASHVAAEATTPVKNPFFNYGSNGVPQRLHGTRDGVRGFDF